MVVFVVCPLGVACPLDVVSEAGAVPATVRTAAGALGSVISCREYWPGGRAGTEKLIGLASGAVGLVNSAWARSATGTGVSAAGLSPAGSEELLATGPVPLALADDSLDYFLTQPAKLVNRPNTLVIGGLAQLQKLALPSLIQQNADFIKVIQHVRT